MGKNENGEKRSVAIAKKARTSKKEVNFHIYISKLAKNHAPKMTIAKETLTEIDLLTEYAIGQINRDAGCILRYSGTGTYGLKTALAAVSTSFSGLLKQEAVLAGNVAMQNFNKSSEIAV